MSENRIPRLEGPLATSENLVYAGSKGHFAGTGIWPNSGDPQQIFAGMDNRRPGEDGTHWGIGRRRSELGRRWGTGELSGQARQQAAGSTGVLSRYISACKDVLR
jgi:hypothetical protein